MGKKRQTDNQRPMAFGATADREALNTAIESLIAIRDARFTTPSKPPRKPPPQARRVAWRILKDWLEAQFALYSIGQAEMAQVLMPYAIDKEGRTAAYQAFKESHVKQLNAAPDNVVEGNFSAVNE